MKIRYYDNAYAGYLYMDLDGSAPAKEPKTTAIPDIDGLPAQLFAASANGQTEYYCAFKYTLRDDMARNIRRRFFAKDRPTGALREMFTAWDMSGFQPNNYMFLRDGLFFTVASFPGGDNAMFLVDTAADFDGANPREIFRSQAYPYGIQISPDGSQLAFHLAGHDEKLNPRGEYAINIIEADGKCHMACSEAGHLFFGPTWSPDGRLLVFQDCVPSLDPAHHFSDIAVCRPDGSGFRRLTSGRCHYFGTSFGLAGHRMGGSNCPIWTPDSKIIYSPMLPNSHPDCHFDPTQPNHEELIFDPGMGRGGSCLSILDPETGEDRALTELRRGSWDFRPCLSPDGAWLLYTHSEFGAAGEVRLMDMSTGAFRRITRGTDGLGADHARFV